MSDLTALDSLLTKLPSGWSSPAIANVARLINGRGFKPHEWVTDGLPIIRIQNLNGSTDFNYYSGSYNPKIEVNTGDLLFAWSGSRGTSFGPHFWSGPKGVLNYHTWRVKVDESAISPDFFYHALRFLTRIIEDRAHGASALVHVQKWEMEKFGFPCPNDRAEQQAIAAALSDTDGMVAGLERVIAKKRLIKQGAMQDLLTARRLPGFSGEWEVKKLGELVTIIMGQSPSSTAYNSAGDGLPLIQGNADIKDRKAITRVFTRQVTKLGRAGDYLMTVRAPVGEIATTDMDVCLGRGVCALRTEQRIVYHIMVSKEPEWAKLSKGSTFDSVNGAEIRAFEVLFPADTAERHAVAQVLDDMDAEIQTLETRLAKARAVKEGMMQNLLTGRVRLV